jgi:putative oxidoreductase
MKSLHENYIKLNVSLLILLWTYASLSKLINFSRFQEEMYNQVFPEWLSTIIPYVLPLTEAVVAIFLYNEKTRKAGINCSFILLLIFTIYITLILLHIFPRMPCSCGGILEHMGWIPHLLFNCAYLILTSISIFILYKKGAAVTEKN